MDFKTLQGWMVIDQHGNGYSDNMDSFHAELEELSGAGWEIKSTSTFQFQREQTFRLPPGLEPGLVTDIYVRAYLQRAQ